MGEVATLKDERNKFNNALIGLVAILVLAICGVYRANNPGKHDNSFQVARDHHGKTVKGQHTLPQATVTFTPPPVDIGDSFQEWQSIWEQDHPSLKEACKPIEDMMVAAENSGRATFEGKVIGYRKKPGKNGIGDRLKAITGMVMVAIGMERPIRIAVKADAFDFINILRQPTSVQIPWHYPWHRFETEKSKVKHAKMFACVPDETTMNAYNQENITLFYQAEGGDHLVDGWWLEKYMTSKGKGPKNRGEWGPVAEFCIMRALFRPGKDLLKQMKMDIEAVAALPLGLTYGDTPDTFLLGVHARYVGRYNIEKGSVRQTDSDISNQIKCSWKMSFNWAQQMATVKSKIQRQVVWLISSDNPEVFFAEAKEYVAKHAKEMPDGIVVNVAHSTTGIVRHIKFDASGPAMFRMWLDWFLLSEANACSIGASGFPETACKAAARRFLSHGKIRIGSSGCGDWQDSDWRKVPKEESFENYRMHIKNKRQQCPIIYP